jgi:chorismate synthase
LFNDNNHSLYKGNKVSVEIYGASHAEKIGVKIKGLKKGDAFCKEELQSFMNRRKANDASYSTTRGEADKVVYIKGEKNGTLTGKPFIAEIYNSTMRSKDYGDGVVLPRPAHADYVGYVKYGDKFDYRGGGKFSGRMTAPMCIAGGILKQLLKKQGITVNAYVKSIGSVVGMGYLDVDVENFDFSKIESEFPLLDESVRQDMLDLIKNVKTDLDSVGGTIECVIKGVKAGEGEFMFDSIESVISRLAFAVPAVKGIEFGLGFGFAKSNGSKVNDPFYYDEKGSVKTKTNFNAGINGGISNGNPITFRVVIKPTPSIAKEQDTINLKTGKNDKIKIVGRHDACIVPRAVSVIEAIASLAIYDIIK